MTGITTSAPGRICLFGEHQDYLHLPVITAAVNLRICISGTPRADRVLHLRLPDIGAEERIMLPPAGHELEYQKERDYFRSSVNVLQRDGVALEHGFDCVVRGDIPINSGTASSSALCVAWCAFLMAACGRTFGDPAALARLAHRAEVLEFGEPGGMMDHYAAAYGGVLHLAFNETTEAVPLPDELGTFVLGDSGEPKDTKGILRRLKSGVQAALARIRREDASFDLATAGLDAAASFQHELSPAQFDVLRGALLNRDLTREALLLFKAQPFDHRRFGELLNAHQEVLDRLLGISTPKINRMLAAARDAGAPGGKINGSGGGGCMFVYAPENSEAVARAIEAAGGKAYIITVDCGIEQRSE